MIRFIVYDLLFKVCVILYTHLSVGMYYLDRYNTIAQYLMIAALMAIACGVILEN